MIRTRAALARTIAMLEPAGSWLCQALIALGLAMLAIILIGALPRMVLA